jgi:hypothetical protein
MSKNIHTGPRTMGARRSVIKPSFSEADLARIAASDATDNLTGKAIHEIGTEIAKTDFSKFKKKDPLKPKKEQTPETPLDEDIFKELGGGLDISNVDWEDEDEDIYVPAAAQKITPSGVVMPVPKIARDMGLPLYKPNSFNEVYPTIQTERVGGSTFSQDVSGTAGHMVDMSGFGLSATPPAVMKASADGPIQRLNPLKRLDPEMEVLSDGDPIYGVGDGKSLAYGMNIGRKQRNYERQVWENQKKNTEDKFGDLMVPAEGEDPNITAQLKGYGMEILNDYKELRGKRMEMEDTEYVALEQELLSRSANIKALRESLVAQANTWLANKDNASVSTPAASRDFFETISNNKGDLKIENVNGTLTLHGKTQAGGDVSIPAHKIINGENIFRFNEKVDIYGDLLDPLTKDLERYKTDKQIEYGISKEMIPFKELEPRIDSYLKNYLKDRTAVQSVLGDGYGYSYEQQIAKEKEGVNLREIAADALKADIKKMLGPAYQQKDIQTDPTLAAKQRAKAFNLSQQAAGGTAGERTSGNIAQDLGSMKPISQANYKEYEQKISKSNFEKGYRIVYTKGKPTVVKYDLKTGKPEFARSYNQKIMLELAGAQTGTKLPILNK